MDSNRGPLESEATALPTEPPPLPLILLFISGSVTRLGDFLHFGQLFKAFGNNYFTQIANIVMQF